MGRQLGLLFACQLVICQSLMQKSNLVSMDEVLTVKTEPVLSNVVNTRIIGGTPTGIEKYPYVVSLQNNGTFFGHDYEHFCVGNIVTEKWILTAAKCCYGKKPSQFHVRVGSESYYKGGRIHKIESIEIHPNYSDITWDYDVGLLKLYENIIFDKKSQPIKLPKLTQPIENRTVLDIAGWGATELLGFPSNTINANNVSTISQSECRNVYSKDAVTDRMFCVFKEGNGPCIGDTGSPAVLDSVLIGVASWSQSCAYVYPTAYARLPEMVDWITKVTVDSSSRDLEPNNTTTVSVSVILIVFVMFFTLDILHDRVDLLFL